MSPNMADQTATSYGYRAGTLGQPVALAAAEIVVPILHRWFQPASVVDVGCGTGDWLSVFSRLGAPHVVGYDASWVPDSSLVIPRSSFRRIELGVELPPVERFELALCLEVAEHLPEAAADRLVARLCQCSDVILWSAAIPGQGGHGHINEKYQSYWIEQFDHAGLRGHDLIRPFIWRDERVPWWYRQNLLVFCRAAAAAALGLPSVPFVADVVHPILFEQARDPRRYSLKAIARHLPHYITRRFRS